MNDISMVTGASLESVREAAPVRPASTTSARSTERARDRIDISEMARLLSKMQGVRQDLVDRVRAEIDRGEYETPQKIDEAAKRIQQELSDDLDLLA